MAVGAIGPDEGQPFYFKIVEKFGPQNTMLLPSWSRFRLAPKRITGDYELHITIPAVAGC
jgi:hypothetical protein